MLRTCKKPARFVGGLQASRLTDWHVEKLRGLRIGELWFACDTPGALRPLKKALARLNGVFRRRQLRCYVMVGQGGETVEQARHRLEQVWEAGCLPFAQMYHDDAGPVLTTPPWRKLVREFSRPAATFRVMEKAGDGPQGEVPRCPGQEMLAWTERPSPGKCDVPHGESGGE
jgi:hypothetical protein